MMVEAGAAHQLLRSGALERGFDRGRRRRQCPGRSQWLQRDVGRADTGPSRLRRSGQGGTRGTRQRAVDELGPLGRSVGLGGGAPLLLERGAAVGGCLALVLPEQVLEALELIVVLLQARRPAELGHREHVDS